MQEEIDKTELVWPDKGTEVNPPILPFQTIETVNEPRVREKPLGLGSDSSPRDWKNKLIWGDNKYVLSSLKRKYEGKIDLIYIDPPFATGADFSIDIEVGKQEVTKQPSIIEELAYRDTWGKGLSSYLQMMYERLVLMRELLSDKGSIYVHCDQRVNSHLRLILDEIFGRSNLVNHISWQKLSAAKAQSEFFSNIKDTILLYAKDKEEATFHPQYLPLDLEEEKKNYPYVEEDTGRRYGSFDFTQNGEGPARRFGDQVLEPPPGKHWIWSQERIDKGLEEGRIIFTSQGTPRVKRYLDEKEGNYVGDIWNDDQVAPLYSNNRERVNYPTQKSEGLLERCIKASSNEGAIVADFFCGSGTTGAAAEKFDRRWILSDLSKFAIQTTRKRLLNLHNYSKDYDNPARPFEILNLGNYQKYKFTENGHPPVEEYQEFILELYEAKPIEGYSFLQGRKGSTFVHIASVDGIVTEDEVKDATEECRNAAGGNKLDVLGWDFEMGLDRMVDQIGEMYGVNVNLKVIPKEATEIKNAAEEGEHIKFFDLNYVEIEHEVNNNELGLEITDFVLANPEYVPEKVRETVEVFTDYIDYWAVDFDYQDDTFHNMWQTFRTRDRKQLETSCKHEYDEPGTKKVLVKVIDVFGNDTNELLEVDING